MFHRLQAYAGILLAATVEVHWCREVQIVYFHSFLHLCDVPPPSLPNPLTAATHSPACPHPPLRFMSSLKHTVGFKLVMSTVLFMLEKEGGEVIFANSSFLLLLLPVSLESCSGELGRWLWGLHRESAKINPFLQWGSLYRILVPSINGMSKYGSNP